MISKGLLLTGVVLSLFPGASHAGLIDTTIESSFIGRTSRGGIVQANANISTGVISTYGDVFRAHHVFDTSELVSAGAKIISATLQITVGTFSSYLTETLTVGGYDGTYVYNDTFNSFSPCCSFNRTIFPTLSVGDFGSASLDPQNTAAGDVLSISFNTEGVQRLQQDVDGANSTTVLGTRFGIPVPERNNRFLSPSNSSLLVSYMAAEQENIGVVPAPTTAALIGIGLLGLSASRRNPV
ncbi:MAG: PEP-CTERM sorting domain-containing protein [Pseudomonadota bacterium]